MEEIISLFKKQLKKIKINENTFKIDNIDEVLSGEYIESLLNSHDFNCFYDESFKEKCINVFDDETFECEILKSNYNKIVKQLVDLVEEKQKQLQEQLTVSPTQKVENIVSETLEPKEQKEEEKEEEQKEKEQSETQTLETVHQQNPAIVKLPKDSAEEQETKEEVITENMEQKTKEEGEKENMEQKTKELLNQQENITDQMEVKEGEEKENMEKGGEYNKLV